MNKTLLSLSFIAAGVIANAGLDMDQINSPSGMASIVSTPGFGVMQIFPDFATFSGTNVDEFTASGGTVTNVDVAYELSSTSVNLNLITGWRVSVFSSVAAAAASGDNLIGDVGTELVAGNQQGNTTTLSGTGALGPARLTKLTTNISGLTAGNTYWIGAAPVLEFVASGGQTFILSNTDPAKLGGTANDSWGVNPSNGFGLGSSTFNGANAAYAVTTVPEPATMIALGAGLAAFARRRRSK